ncbi:MAG: flavodoxin family protein [Candidatus Odinarchaeota archaeon]
MKALSIYFTMGGRTKRMAEAIASALNNYEVTYFPVELKGSLIERIKLLEKYEEGNYSSLEVDLDSLDAADYDLVIIGMPTFGSSPPKTFDEILRRLKNLEDKDVVLFGTSRFRRGGLLHYMKEKVETKGGRVTNQMNFRGLIMLGTKKAIKFGEMISSS